MSSAQVEAVLFGLALGDALGYPVEFLSLDAIRQSYGPAGIQEPPVPSLYSDDTQMTLALANGIAEVGPYVPIDDLMKSVGQRFIMWLHSADNNRAPGSTCMKGIRRFEAGVDWRDSGVAESKGCGSAMRVAPLGYIYQYDDMRLREVASATSRLTHGHPAATAAAIAAAYWVKLALDEVPVSTYLPRIYEFTVGISEEFDLALLRVGHVLGWGNEDLALAHIGEGWTGEEAVALALYCVLRHPDDYVTCIRRAANTNGDSDTIACIAGGIMGARLGLESMPESWRARCENAAEITMLASRLAAVRGS